MSRLAGVTPFPSDFAARYRERGYWEDVPLGRFYAGVFASHGKRAAMISGSERVTYAELRERVERLALHLLDLGVAPLDRWVVQLPNIPEFVYLYFALERLGAIPIMALAGHRWNEINAFFELAGATGYAGMTAVNLLARHPRLRVEAYITPVGPTCVNVAFLCSEGGRFVGASGRFAVRKWQVRRLEWQVTGPYPGSKLLAFCA